MKASFELGNRDYIYRNLDSFNGSSNLYSDVRNRVKQALSTKHLPQLYRTPTSLHLSREEQQNSAFRTRERSWIRKKCSNSPKWSTPHECKTRLNDVQTQLRKLLFFSDESENQPSSPDSGAGEEVDLDNEPSLHGNLFKSRQVVYEAKTSDYVSRSPVSAYSGCNQYGHSQRRHAHTPVTQPAQQSTQQPVEQPEHRAAISREALFTAHTGDERPQTRPNTSVSRISGDMLPRQRLDRSSLSNVAPGKRAPVLARVSCASYQQPDVHCTSTPVDIFMDTVGGIFTVRELECDAGAVFDHLSDMFCVDGYRPNCLLTEENLSRKSFSMTVIERNARVLKWLAASCNIP